MNAAKLLRQKILDLAIRGKLTKREKGDEPAAALLARIAAEKQKLIAEKKIKKEKPLPPITDEEKLFDIPEGWEWCRLGVVIKLISSKQYQIQESKVESVGKYPVVSQGQGIVDGYCNEESKVLRDVPVIVFGDHTRNVKFVDFPFVVGADGTKVFSTNVDGRWMYFWVAYAAEIQMVSRGYGRHWGALNAIPVPLPPLAEQKRIVACVEELLAEVDKYSAAMDTLTSSSKMMEKKVLDLAIRGKLTEREKGDEPAAALLARIAEEKQKLIAEKKIKKEKPLPPITDDEKPFDIPEGWEWCRLGAVIEKAESKLPVGEYFDYIDIDAIDNKCNLIKEPKHLLSAKAPSRASRGLKEGDVLFSMVRPYLKNIARVDVSYAHCIASTGFHVCRPTTAIDSCYLFSLMVSDYVVNGLNAHMKGDNSPSINVRHIELFPIPLPPLAEQKRIVARVDELLADCRKMRGE